ncbi:MAG: response regulator transcription factor [Sterolibacterium sp.]
MIRILLIDDHAVVRSGYRRFLERSTDIRVVAEAENAEQGYLEFRQQQPDVTVLDLSMPGSGGLALIRKLIAHEPQACILVFSMHEEAVFAARSLQAGARGYVTKNSAPETLIEAVRRVHAGHSFLSPDIAPRLLGSAEADPLAVLSVKEFDIFRLIAEGQTLAEISEAMNLSQKTVANYQTLIKEKLGAPTIAALVHVALRHGVLTPPN